MSDTAFPLPTVAALVVSPQGRVLLTQSHKWKHAWGVPGGKIDLGERMKDALEREFIEETGLKLYDIRWAETQEAINTDAFYKPAHFIFLNYIARCDSEAVKLNDEAQSFAWVTPEEALKYNLNSYTRNLLRFYLEHGFTTKELV